MVVYLIKITPRVYRVWVGGRWESGGRLREGELVWWDGERWLGDGLNWAAGRRWSGR
jgi:hypothetical protein